MNPDIASLVIASLALLVSVVSGWATYRAQRSQAAVHERLLALEATRERARNRETRRARLRAQLVGFGSDQRLLITNEGEASARNIRVNLDGRPITEHVLWVRGQDVLQQIGTGASADYILAFAMGKPTSFLVELFWTDDSGEAGTWGSQLKI